MKVWPKYYDNSSKRCDVQDESSKTTTSLTMPLLKHNHKLLTDGWAQVPLLKLISVQYVSFMVLFNLVAPEIPFPLAGNIVFPLSEFLSSLISPSPLICNISLSVSIFLNSLFFLHFLYFESLLSLTFSFREPIKVFIYYCTALLRAFTFPAVPSVLALFMATLLSLFFFFWQSCYKLY